MLDNATRVSTERCFTNLIPTGPPGAPSGLGKLIFMTAPGESIDTSSWKQIQRFSGNADNLEKDRDSEVGIGIAKHKVALQGVSGGKPELMQ